MKCVTFFPDAHVVMTHPNFDDTVAFFCKERRSKRRDAQLVQFKAWACVAWRWAGDVIFCQGLSSRPFLAITMVVVAAATSVRRVLLSKKLLCN